jgi:hypothetical protein
LRVGRAETRRSAVFQLKTDIEHVTLNELITRFEEMLGKNLSEAAWQA